MNQYGYIILGGLAGFAVALTIIVFFDIMNVILAFLIGFLCGSVGSWIGAFASNDY